MQCSIISSKDQLWIWDYAESKRINWEWKYSGTRACLKKALESPGKNIFLWSDLWYTLCITYRLPGGDDYAKYIDSILELEDAANRALQGLIDLKK